MWNTKRFSRMPDVPCLFPDQFTNLLMTQLPVYVPQILRDVTPTDGLMGHIQTGQWDPYSGVQHIQDRFRGVKANTAKKWYDVSDTGCVAGNQAPCDPPENEICFGWERTTFGQQRQSWKSQLFCFDQMLSATKAVEHIAQIVGEVLKPATSDVTSMYVRKKALELSGTKLTASAGLTPFTFTWSTTGDEEIFMNPSAFPTSKLTPEMIQRQIPKMRGIGYFGNWTNDPFWGGYGQFAELITDDDTCWDMDKVATNQRLADLYRFQIWNAAHEYYKYGMGGQIGNYMTHVDPFCLRFNRRGNQLQLVLPYHNDPTTVGIGRDWNDDYDRAQYQISFTWHRFAWQLEVQKMEAVNPLMPFLVRGLNGEWRFAMNNLGADCAGKPISNYRQNKGFFYADWRLAAHPLHTEWLTAWLHLREPKVIYTVAPCAADPGYPEQDYNSACDGCGTTFEWQPDLYPSQSMSASTTNGDATVTVADTSNLAAGQTVTGTGIPASTTVLSITNGTTFELSANATATGTPTLTFGAYYRLEANSVSCNDEPQDNAAIRKATLATLVTAFQGDTALGALGTWSTSGGLLILSDATCRPVLPWVT